MQLICCCAGTALKPASCADAGIRRWPQEYLPSIFDDKRVNMTMDITQREAEETMRAMAKVEGLQPMKAPIHSAQ